MVSDGRLKIKCNNSQRRLGMFLYVKLVMKNLLDQTRLVKLRKELKPGIFPKGIDQAYITLSSHRHITKLT